MLKEGDVLKNKGGRPKILTPIEELSVYKTYENHISIAEIAYKHNISASTVYRTVKRIKKQKESGEHEKHTHI